MLSSMLLNDGEIIPAITPILAPHDFYRPEHRLIFEAIVKVFEEKQQVNLLSLNEQLKSSGVMDKVGISTVFAISEAANTTAYSISYAQQLKEKSSSRQILNALENVAQETASGTMTPAEICETFSDLSIYYILSREEKRAFSYAEYLQNQFDLDVAQQKKYSNRKTGFDNIDLHQRFKPGLYILGGVPGCGKTTFAWQLANHLANNGEECIFVSYEMTRLQLFSKSIACELFRRNPFTSLSSSSIAAGCFSSEFPQMFDDVKQLNPRLSVIDYLDDSADLFPILRAWINASTIKNGKAPIIFIDYLQLIGSKLPNIKDRVDDNLRKLKTLQKDTQATIIVISSFNRMNYYQQVSYECYKESGIIEYTADVIWGMQLYIVNSFKTGIGVSDARKQVEEANNQQPRAVHFKCLKNRFGNTYGCYFNYFSAHDF